MSDRPFAGRRFYFVGIGGAGLSAYANFARAWGAEVRGWDVRETIFLEALDGIEVDVGGEPAPPPGFEVIVSTAHAGRVEGRPRAEFLAELVARRRSIVVGGAHGKSTTAAMIAYVLRELGLDPAWIVGGVVPQLGGNAGVGEGWLVVEGDESDRSIGLLEPEIAVVTNVELDHHASYASEAELAAYFDEWLARAPSTVRGWELEPADAPARDPGRAQPAQCRHGARGARARRRRARRGRARPRAASRASARRFELVGERGGVRVLDDYGHNPTEIAATLATARELDATGPDRRLPAARVRAHAPAVPGARCGARARRRGDRDRRDRRPRRPASRRDRKARPRPRARRPTRRGWAPGLDDAANLALAWARPGDVIVTLGVGEPWRIARAIVEGLHA